MTAPTENVGRYGIGTGFRIHNFPRAGGDFGPPDKAKRTSNRMSFLREFLPDQFSLDIIQGGFDGFLFILCVFVKLAERTAILV